MRVEMSASQNDIAQCTKIDVLSLIWSLFNELAYAMNRRSPHEIDLISIEIDQLLTSFPSQDNVPKDVFYYSPKKTVC